MVSRAGTHTNKVLLTGCTSPDVLQELTEHSPKAGRWQHVGHLAVRLYIVSASRRGAPRACPRHASMPAAISQKSRTVASESHALNSACPVNTAADLSRLIPPDLRFGVVWLIRLGCAEIGYLSAAAGSSVTLNNRWGS